MAHKDYFSAHANVYAAFRPAYPEELYHFIFSHLKNKNTAWDCATGNGQVAQHLAQHIGCVFATDISQQQLDHAFRSENIFYSVSPAEKTSFADNQFDLITVGQALHWFNREAFYTEVTRVSKPGALLAVWGYETLSIHPDIDKLFLHFYRETVGPYWDEARKLVEDQYKTIAFPFAEIPSPGFTITTTWTSDHFAGYLTSWSATQKYMRVNNENPVTPLMENVTRYWKKGEVKQVTFPVFMRLGVIHK